MPSPLKLFTRGTPAPGTLEARLIYLSLSHADNTIADALERYRQWLLKQKSKIVQWSEIGAAPLSLPDHLHVGHPQIDKDHQILFHYANQVREALRQEDLDKAMIIALEMVDEILAHFEREEKILKDANYPDLENHCKYHKHLKSKSPALRKELSNLAKGGNKTIAAFDALITFLVNDPIVADMDFKPFFARL